MTGGLSLSGLDWVVCLGALAASILIGLWLSVRAHSSQNSAGFFLAGRSLRWPVIGASLFATNIGAEKPMHNNLNNQMVCAILI